jgi:BON domain
VRGSPKAARRLPGMRRSRRIDIPLPEIHFTAGPKLELPVPRLEAERRRHYRLRTLTAASGTAAAVYLLDPQQGRRRRHMARDRGMKLLRQARRRAERQARYAAGVQAGKRAEQQPAPPKAELNDPALARKVETEIFRDAGAPKGTVDVNVEQGVVYLRGQVEDQATLERLVDQARTVEGVHAVESLLHLPGQPPAA